MIHAARTRSAFAVAALALLMAACANSGGVNVMGEVGRPDGAPAGTASTASADTSAGTSAEDGAAKNPDGSPNLSKIMTIAFADARWDEDRVPKGEQCSALGGKGATPSLSVNGIPKGAVTVTASYQAASGDKSGRGDMGVIGYRASGLGNMLLPSVAGETASVSGAKVVSSANGAAGYLPPCRKGTSYTVTVQALNGSGRALATKTVSIGKL